MNRPVQSLVARLAAFLVLAIILALSAGLTGCTPGGESPEKAVSQAVAALKTHNTRMIDRYLDYDALTTYNDAASDILQDDTFARLFFARLACAADSANLDGDQAAVTARITQLDMRRIFGEYLTAAMKIALANDDDASGPTLGSVALQQKTDAAFMDLLKRDNNQTTTATVIIQLVKYGTSWQLVMDDDLQDALLGGMVSATEDFSRGSLAGDPVSVQGMLSEITAYISEDLWTRGFCDIGTYLADGTDSLGEPLDVAATLDQLTRNYARKASYDAYMANLDKTRYGNLQTIWFQLSAEADRLYSQLQVRQPVAGDTAHPFDSYQFQECLDDYIAAYYDLLA
jgi:hypothetical protein